VTPRAALPTLFLRLFAPPQPALPHRAALGLFAATTR
jgi:hypothetical protein